MKKLIVFVLALALLLLMVLGMKTITGSSYLLFGGIIAACIAVWFALHKSVKAIRKTRCK